MFYDALAHVSALASHGPPAKLGVCKICWKASKAPVVAKRKPPIRSHRSLSQRQCCQARFCSASLIASLRRCSPLRSCSVREWGLYLYSAPPLSQCAITERWKAVGYLCAVAMTPRCQVRRQTSCIKEIGTALHAGYERTCDCVVSRWWVLRGNRQEAAALSLQS